MLCEVEKFTIPLSFFPLSPSHYLSTVVLTCIVNIFLLLDILDLSRDLITNSTRIHLQLADANHRRNEFKFNDRIRYLPLSEDEMILRKENRLKKTFNYRKCTNIILKIALLFEL